MSFVPTKLYCDSYFPNTETSLTMGNGHTQFAGLSDMTYSWVVDTSNNLVLNGQASGPSPAIQPILIAPNGNVSIPSLDVSGSGVLSVSSSNGSGIKCTGTTNVNITANLIAGSGIVLTPDISDTAIVISCDVSGGDQWNTIPATTNVNMNANCLTNASNLTIGTGNTTVGPFAITLSSDDSNAQIYMGKSNAPTDTGNGGVLSVGSGYQLVYTSQGTSHEFVSSVSAGTGISITGSSSAPIINATGGGGGPTVDAIPAGTKTITIPAGNSIFNYTIAGGGGGGGGSAFAGAGSNSSGGGGGGGGQAITGSIYCTSGNTFIQYTLGSGGAGGTGGNPTGNNGVDGADSTLEVNGSLFTITAIGGKGGQGGNQAGSGIGGNGGDGFYGGGGGQGLATNGSGGVGSSISGTSATVLQGGEGGNNPFPAFKNRISTPNPSTTVVGGNGAGSGGSYTTGTSLETPFSASLGGGGGGGCVNYPTAGVGSGGSGGNGYISYYFTQL